MKVVLVGCGSIAGAWIESAVTMPDLRIVAFVDVVEEAARKRASEYQTKFKAAFNAEVVVPIIGTELEPVLEQTRPDIVFDCTPQTEHYRVVMAALKYGCHIVGEKPLADTMGEAREMIAAVQASGKTYAVTQNRRYNRGSVRLKRFLESGAIGKIAAIHCNYFMGVHFGTNFRATMPYVLLRDMGVHHVDLARYLSGAEATSVYCKSWQLPGSWQGHHATAVAIYDMTDSITFTYNASWEAEGLHIDWDGAWRVIGTQGTVTWDGETTFRAQRVVETKGFASTFEDLDVPDIEGERYDFGHGGVIRDIVRCIREGRTPQTVCTDNIKTMQMIFAAIESAEKRMPVSIADPLA
jgi:predicted dehydrogenase